MLFFSLMAGVRPCREGSPRKYGWTRVQPASERPCRSGKAAIELCQRYPERLVSTCGVHPHHASDWNQASFIALKAITQQHSCVRAIGETGLDFNRNYSPRAEQEYAFEQQMALAVDQLGLRLGLPLVNGKPSSNSDGDR